MNRKRHANMIAGTLLLFAVSGCDPTGSLDHIDNFNEVVRLNAQGQIDLGEAWPAHTRTARFITALEALDKCNGYAHDSVVEKTIVDFWDRNAEKYRHLIQEKIEERRQSTFADRAELKQNGPRFITENFHITYQLGNDLSYHMRSPEVPAGTVPEKVYSYYLRDEINGLNCARHISNVQRRTYDIRAGA